jgi:hypothetical protein
VGWPKGKPRKGHVNADGTPHSKWGQKQKRTPVAPRTVASKVTIRKVTVDSEQEPSVKTPREKKWTVALRWPQGPHPSADKCPNCDYPEAMAGFCPECKWSQPINAQPKNSTDSGRVARLIAADKELARKAARGR